MNKFIDAYYYGFEKTGVAEIDNILYAVARAGKSFHHTEDWQDEATAPEGLRGNTPEEWIQNAANDAAQAIKYVGKVIAERKEEP